LAFLSDAICLSIPSPILDNAALNSCLLIVRVVLDLLSVAIIMLPQISPS
jgi:hypothetical protein